MYNLTLSLKERQAIDWIGDRYRHGTELYKILIQTTQVPDDADWDDTRDITFHIPEHAAWTISEIINEDYLACFGSSISNKLTELQNKIV